MTEQQAPTLAAVIGVDSLYMAPGLHPSDFPIGTKLYALAKNIDTASPSPAGTVGARFDWLLAELAKRFPDAKQAISARAPEPRYLAAIDRLLATPQPSPTGPREGEPPECDYEACKRAHACKFYPCRAPETASPSPASLQEAAISPSGIKTPPDEQIVAAWNAWPKTAITSRRSAIEFVRAVLSQRSADSPLASPVEAQELEDDPEAEAAFHMGYGGEAQETATPSLPLQEPVAWVTPMAYGSQVTFYKPSKPSDWDDSDRGDEWYCRPLYAAPSLPAVLTDAQIDDFAQFIADTLSCFVKSGQAHAIHARALATSATPVLP